MKLSMSVTILMLSIYTSYGQNLESCKAVLLNDTLTLENSMISRKFLWNDGNLISIKFTNKQTGEAWTLKGGTPDTYFVQPEKGTNSHLETFFVTEGLSEPHLRVNIINKVGDLEIKREFKIYPDCPAIAFTLYLKGSASSNWKAENNNIPDNRQHKLADRRVQNMNKEVPTLDRLAFISRHWMFRSVEL